MDALNDRNVDLYILIESLEYTSGYRMSFFNEKEFMIINHKLYLNKILDILKSINSDNITIILDIHSCDINYFTKLFKENNINFVIELPSKQHIKELKINPGMTLLGLYIEGWKLIENKTLIDLK